MFAAMDRADRRSCLPNSNCSCRGNSFVTFETSSANRYACLYIKRSVYLRTGPIRADRSFTSLTSSMSFPSVLPAITHSPISPLFLRHLSCRRLCYSSARNRAKSFLQRGHGTARAVLLTCHAAFKLGGVDAELLGFHFQRIFCVVVAQFTQVFVAKQRVVVEAHLGVERHQAGVASQHAGIDLEQRGA